MIGAWATRALDDVAAYLWQTELERVEAAIATPAPEPTPSVPAPQPPAPSPAAGTPASQPPPPSLPPLPQPQAPGAPAADADAADSTPDIQRLLHALSDQKVLEALIKLLR